MKDKFKNKVQIIVDTFESDSGLFDAILERGLQATVQSMETSDVTIRYKNHTCGIEIKREFDFDSSLKDNRLHSQLYRLTEQYELPILIIENWHPYVGEDDTIETIAKRVNKFKKTIRRLNRLVTVEETKNQDETIDIIEGVISDINLNKFQCLRRKATLIDVSDPQEAILANLPHIGIVKAEKLINLYGCPMEALLNAKDWDIPGVTGERLNEIIDVLHKKRDK